MSSPPRDGTVSFSSKYIPAGVKGMLVMFPGQKPSMVRVEQLSYAWSQDYKRREFVKFRHLLANTEQGDRSPVLSKGCKVQVRMKLKIFHFFLF